MSLKKQMNILWIMTDQHQAKCLGCMGNSVIQTPNIDRLADNGFLFENAFCQSPVCMSSRASLLTGRYPTTIRVHGMGILPPQETTLPEHLQRNGYTTGAFGKVHLTPEQYVKHHLGSDTPIIDWRVFQEETKLADCTDDPFKKDYGFQTHVGCDDACRGNHLNWLKKVAPELLDKPQEKYDNGPNMLFISPYPSEYHHTTYIANNAIDYIKEKKDSDKPWFTFCSFIAPHHPFEAPRDQIDRYNENDIELPSKEIGVDIGTIPRRLMKGIDEFEQYSEDIQKKIILHYYASISLIDDCVGKFVDSLEETGQLDNTIILFVSDHGEHLGSHRLLKKSSFHYDETIKVPLIMNIPGQNKPRRISGLVELVDVYPTLVGILGLEVNAGIQGIDMSDALLNNGNIGREDIYSDMYGMDKMVFAKPVGPFCSCRTIRTQDWKLSVYPEDGIDCSQMFDLKNDPDETKNLFNDPAYRDTREKLLWRFVQRSNSDADPLPLRLTQW